MIRVLVIDDEESARSMVVRMLKGLATVDCAESAHKGAELIKKNDYNYVLLDYQMPEQNGIWFMENVTLPEHTKVVLMTGHADRRLIDDMFKLGAVGYVLKPFDEDELFKHVDLSAPEEPRETESGKHGVIEQVLDVFRHSTVLRRAVIVLWHSIGIYLTYYLAFFLRFEGNIPVGEQVTFWHTLPILLIVCLVVFAQFRLYSGLWAYFSIDDLARTGMALLTAIGLFAVTVYTSRGMSFAGYPRSVFAFEFLLLGFWVGGWRFVIRYVRAYRRGELPEEDGNRDRILIVGKLADADLVVRGARGDGIGKVVGIVSDEAGHESWFLHRIPIFHTSLDEIGAIAQKRNADCILVLPPFNRPGEMKTIVKGCGDINVACVFRTLPSLADLTTGRLTASSIRNIDIEDLLERDAAFLDRTEVRKHIKRKKVMITGAGGSIGAELSRQVAGYEPAVIVLFESSEYALYMIEHDLRERYPNLGIIAYAGDIRHPEEVEDAIDSVGGIDIIYHSAAYKHVPLMESNVAACFRTNVLGTARLAKVAVGRGVDRFVMISSDKAVRPTSMMGATKRIAERVISELAPNGTTFVSVRFGNVLESSGSVVPLFKRQIAAGGPVTVTSPKVRRYFMTVSEAVDLVLVAGTVGLNGEIMVLEMGELIKVCDLARRLIKLSGLIPDKDIKIEYTGLRPGEKEYEEVMTDDEDVVRTSIDKIWVMKGVRNAERGTRNAEGGEKKRSFGQDQQDQQDKRRRNHGGTEGEVVNGRRNVDLGRIEDLVLKNDVKGLWEVAGECVPENEFAKRE